MGLDAVHPGFILTEPPPTPSLHDKRTQHLFARGLFSSGGVGKPGGSCKAFLGLAYEKFSWFLIQMVMGGMLIGELVVVVSVIYVLTLLLL